MDSRHQHPLPRLIPVPVLAAVTVLLASPLRQQEVGGDDDDDAQVGRQVAFLPLELKGSLGAWRGFQPAGKAFWGQGPADGKSCPYVLEDERDEVVVRAQSTGRASTGRAAREAVAAALTERQHPAGVVPRVTSLSIRGGMVVTVDLGAFGSRAYWCPEVDDAPQPLHVPSEWANAVLLVGDGLWVGCGSPHDDPFRGDTGWIIEFRRSDGGWSRTRGIETEQAVFAMEERSEGGVYALCRSLILSCREDLATRVVYGTIGFPTFLLPEQYGRATWRPFVGNTTFRVLGGCYFVGTVHGLIVLSPWGTHGTEVYTETWLVPPDSYRRMQAHGGVAAPVAYRWGTAETGGQ